MRPAVDASSLPFEPYRDLSDVELERRIALVKHQMGDSLLILGHHYQQDEVIRFADLRGDSFKLSQLAADSQTCRAIVFCGVHFMAETADVLSRDDVEVYLPDLAAGCSMADMADLESVEAAWEDLDGVVDTNTITPVTYINSSAELKAFCGGTAVSFAPAPTRELFSIGRSQSATASCFSPISTWAATRPEPWVSPSSGWSSGTRVNRWGKRRGRDRRQSGLALERTLLGASDVQARTR